MFRDVDGGDKSCVMEASSHALALERTTGIAFASSSSPNCRATTSSFTQRSTHTTPPSARCFCPTSIAAGRRRRRNAGDEHGRRLIDDCREA